jgi:hypothetical protein
MVVDLVGRSVLPPTTQHPLIPFLKEPWSSKSSYPAIILETFLYGIYGVLFCTSAFFILRSKIVHKKLLAATSLLFLLGTADILLTLYFFLRLVLQPGVPFGHRVQSGGDHEPWNRILEVKFALYVAANSIASSLLINRCYNLWKNKNIILAPIAMLVVGTIISLVSIAMTRLGDKLLAASFITSAAANLSVTLLIASKMMWTSKKVKGAITQTPTNVVDYISSLLLDSGALYSLSIFLYLLFHTLVIDACLTQIAGVTITAMILRNSQTCESLAQEDSVLNGTTTQPDTRSIDIAPPHEFKSPMSTVRGWIRRGAR